MAIIRLTTCNNIIESNMMISLLQNEGIECFPTNENFTNLLPVYNGLLGSGIQIMIDEADEERALELISSQNKAKIIVCPNCSSENLKYGIGKKGFMKYMIILVSLLNAIPFNNIKNTCYCKDCKTEF